MRTNGNLALNPAYKPQYQPTPKSLRKKSISTQRGKSHKVNVAVAIIYIAIISAIAFCMVAREVQIYEQSNQARQLTVALGKLQSENTQAMLDAERSVDLKHIEQVATGQFGMIRPEKYQTVYISIHQDDYVEKVAGKGIAQQLQQSIGTGVKNLFGIFDTR